MTCKEKSDHKTHVAEEEPLSAEETRTRSLAENRACAIFCLDVLAAFKVFLTHLVTLESVLSATLTVVVTCLIYFYSEQNGGRSTASMDFVLLAITVILPLSATIRFAFVRREQALQALAKFKSSSQSLYTCHATWNFGKGPNGRREVASDMDFLSHSDEVLSCLVSLGDALCRILTLPTSNLPRHRVIHRGRQEAARTIVFANRLGDALVTGNLTKLSLLLEDLKFAGLTPSEASRARQWEQALCNAVEDLRMVKMYRTPQALRSFVTVSILLLPPFYAPAFAHIAREMDSLAVGLTFSVAITLALTGLHESVRALEDPFVTHLTLDGVDIREELSFAHWTILMNVRKVAFPHAPTPCLVGTEESMNGTDDSLEDTTDEEMGQKKQIKRPSRFYSDLSTRSFCNDVSSTLPSICEKGKSDEDPTQLPKESGSENDVKESIGQSDDTTLPNKEKDFSRLNFEPQTHSNTLRAPLSNSVKQTSDTRTPVPRAALQGGSLRASGLVRRQSIFKDFLPPEGITP